MSEIEIATQPIRRRIDELFQNQGIVVAGIGGGSATGKTSLFPQILSCNRDCLLLSQDDYCIGSERSAYLHGQPNLHVPEDYQVDLQARHIASLKNGEIIRKPKYSFKTREPDGFESVQPSPLIALEGEFPLHDVIAPLLDIGIFIDTDDHSRFARRMIRPRRNPQQTDTHRVLEYFSLSFPFYHSHVLPTRKNADVILTNPYSPAEGNERLETVESEMNFTGDASLLEIFRSAFPSAIPQQFRHTYYSHPCCTAGEIVAMLQYEQSGNELLYASQSQHICDGLVRNPSACFRLGNEIFDLQNVGYCRKRVQEGLVWTTCVDNCIRVDCYAKQDKYWLRLSVSSRKKQAAERERLLRQHARSFAGNFTSVV
jgi:uridine kinase